MSQPHQSFLWTAGHLPTSRDSDSRAAGRSVAWRLWSHWSPVLVL